MSGTGDGYGGGGGDGSGIEIEERYCEITVQQALGDKFNYAELMGGAP